VANKLEAKLWQKLANKLTLMTSGPYNQVSVVNYKRGKKSNTSQTTCSCQSLTWQTVAEKQTSPNLRMHSVRF
jgi:hypothetical protein